MPIEKKLFACTLELKELTEDGQFEGHAAVFNNVDLGGDRIKRGAFTRTIAETGGRWPIHMGHILSRPVGFSTSGEEDGKGLKVVGEFTLGSTDGRNAYEIVKHAVRVKQPFGLSIGYGIGENGAKFNSETGVRDLTDLDVYEFSLASVPMNQRARVGRVKSAGELNEREVEGILREAGFSKNEAKDLIHSMKGLREVDSETVSDLKVSAAFNDLLTAADVIYQFTNGLENIRHGRNGN